MEHKARLKKVRDNKILRAFVNGRDWSAKGFMAVIDRHEADHAAVTLFDFQRLAEQARMMAYELERVGHPYEYAGTEENPYRDELLHTMLEDVMSSLTLKSTMGQLMGAL